MADHYSRNDDNHDKKRQKLNNENIDDDEYNEDPRIPQTSLAFLFGGEVLLFEALPYLHALTIVEKKVVCRQWKDKCNAAIIRKGRQVKQGFGNNIELRDAVKSYCRGNRDDAENIAEEYGYPIGKWDVSRVEDFSHAFWNMESFNEDIGAWDVGNATDMKFMFSCARSFNQNLSGWDVSNVRNMCAMFHRASSFNKSLSGWDVSKVESMDFMFQYTNAFNGNLSTWDTSSVTKMKYMFHCAKAFNGDLSTWDTSSVTNMGFMFWGATAFNVDISGWNVARVTYMYAMFTDDARFDQHRLNLIKLSWERQGKRWW